MNAWANDTNLDICRLQFVATDVRTQTCWLSRPAGGYTGHTTARNEGYHMDAKRLVTHTEPDAIAERFAYGTRSRSSNPFLTDLQMGELTCRWL